MKTKNLKRIFTMVLTLAMLATMFVLPTNAALPETTVQEWDFTGFKDGNYTGTDANWTDENIKSWFPNIGEYNTALSALTSSDGKITLGVKNAYWNLCKYWNVNNGLVTFNSIGYSSGRHAMVISLKLDKDLRAGIPYTVSTDLSVTLSAWVENMSIYYSESLSAASSEEDTSGKAITGSTVLYKNYKGEDNTNGFGADSIPKSITFTPETDLAAGGCISFRLDLRDTTASATVSTFKLTAQIPYADSENTAVYDEWDFSKIPNQSTSGQTIPDESTDGRIVLGIKNAYWNRYTTWDVADGKVEFNSVNASAEHKDNFSLGFKLDTDLKAGVTYNFVTDLNYQYISNEWASRFDFYYTPNKDNNYLGEDFLTNMPEGSVSLGGYTKTGGFGSLPSTFTFTPETDLAAGGYLNIRYGLYHSVNKLTISEAKITAAPITTLRHYDLTTAEDRAQLLGSRTTNVADYTLGEDTVINWTQGGLGFKDFTFESDKYYRLTFEYACYGDRTINLWTASPSAFTDSDAKWKANNIALIPSTGGANANNISTYSFDFYSRTDMSYDSGNIPMFFNSFSGGTMVVKSITISEYSKVNPMVADTPAVPELDNRLYTSIVLPAINTTLQQYAMVDDEGNYTSIEGNTVTGLQYDTEYKFVVKYIDSYKYYEGDYSEAITVKTRKRGDVTGDEKVNIIDLVRLKKGLTTDETNPVYDIEPEGGEAGSLVYMRRIILGIVK